MNLVGYLLTLANMQGFDHNGGPIQDLSVKVGEIQTLIYDLSSYPQFPLNKFKDTGYYRDGNMGIYLSKNLRDYAFNGIGDPSDEAVVLTLMFNNVNAEVTPTNTKDPSKTLSYYLRKGEVDHDVQKGINQYVNNLSNRQKRTASETKE